MFTWQCECAKLLPEYLWINRMRMLYKSHIFLIYYKQRTDKKHKFLVIELLETCNVRFLFFCR